MRMSDGVEWMVHCCSLLAALPPGQALPAAKLAEFHEVPPAYLAKHLQAASAAGIVESVAGRRGGYRLARPAGEVSLLDIVLAVDGDDTAFRCSEIRQRGPVRGPATIYRRPCGIARAMWRAEDAWRAELAATSIEDIVLELAESAPAPYLEAHLEWVQQVEINRGARRTEGIA
jgi:Rrf2 family protein